MACADQKKPDTHQQTAECLQSYFKEDLYVFPPQDSVKFKIIGIGESTHGSSTLLKSRIKITKQLIEKCGFRSVGIEACADDVYELDNFINKNYKEEIERIIFRMNYPFLANEDFKEFILWLRDYNSTHKLSKVNIFGFDTSVSNAPVSSMISFANKYSPVLADALDTLMGSVAKEGIYKYDKYRPNYLIPVDSALEEKVLLLKNLLQEERRDLIAASSIEDVELFEENLEMMGQLLARMKFSLSSIESQTIRDSSMYSNIRRRFENSMTNRIVVWAHNEHLYLDVQHPKRTLGYYLKAHFEGYFYNIGSDFGTGKYSINSFDGMKTEHAAILDSSFSFYSSGGAFFEFSSLEYKCQTYVRVHSIPAINNSGSMEKGIRLSKSFDAFIFIPMSRELEFLKKNNQ